MPGQYLAHTWCKKAIPTPNTTTTTHTQCVQLVCWFRTVTKPQLRGKGTHPLSKRGPYNSWPGWVILLLCALFSWTLSLPSSTAACSLKLLIRFLNIYMCIHTHTHMHILPMPQSEFPSWSHILGGNLWEHILIMILTMGIAGMWQTNKRNSGNHFGQGGIFKENVSSNFLLNHTIWVVTFSYWQNFLPY